VVDADCCDLRHYNQLMEVAKETGFVGYAIELNQDEEICCKYNDHQREAEDIKAKIDLLSLNPTPAEHTLLDPEYLYGEYSYDKPLLEDAEMMDVSDVEEIMSDVESEENFSSDSDTVFGPLKMKTIKSKWDDVEDDTTARLDGTGNKNIKRMTMADYLLTEEEWTMRPSASGKKRVRWADIEEKKVQDRMREVGFIVGQTDWKRMTDDSDGRNALEQTKYIESRSQVKKFAGESSHSDAYRKPNPLPIVEFTMFVTPESREHDYNEFADIIINIHEIYVQWNNELLGSRLKLSNLFKAPIYFEPHNPIHFELNSNSNRETNRLTIRGSGNVLNVKICLLKNINLRNNNLRRYEILKFHGRRKCSKHLLSRTSRDRTSDIVLRGEKWLDSILKLRSTKVEFTQIRRLYAAKDLGRKNIKSVENFIGFLSEIHPNAKERKEDFHK